MNNEKYLKVAILAAKNSGKIFKKYFGKPKDIQMKNGDPRNLVTEIDKKIETQIRKLILKNFPAHKIIGEEFGSHKLKKDDLVWIIDPIDGTINFIQGLPLGCISIALWDKNGPVVGVIYNPVLNYLFSSLKGHGAFLNGKKIKVSNKQHYGGFGWGRRPKKAAKIFPVIVHQLPKIRALGSCTLEFAFVAAGIFDFHVQAEINVWDFAAATLLVEEAGGRITDWKGRKISMSTTHVVAGNKQVHQKLVRTLKKF